MRRIILSAQLLFSAAYLPGCAGNLEGADGDPSASVVPGSGKGDVGGAEPTDVDPTPRGPAGGNTGEGNGGVLPIDPNTVGAGNPAPAPVPVSGLSLNGGCFAVCASNATDVDPSGQTDGWGYENDASCLVAGSAPAGQAMPCSLQPALPRPIPSLPSVNVQKPEGVDSSGFFVSGGRLLDPLGNDFVMRGVNNPLAWFRNRNTGALAWTEQIASTGANTVRLVWETDVADVTLLRDAIQRSIDFGMVPMVELHDVTGGRDVDEPARMARYYADTPAVRQILIDYESFLLVNIANEWDGADNIYVEAYTRAIQTMRNAGLNHTLVLDANGYGQKANTVIAQGRGLLAVDPQHNLLFSTHMYESFRNAQTIRDTLQRVADAQVPFIVGEFGFQHGSDNQGNPIPIPIDVLFEEAQRHGFGYLGWSWTGNSANVGYLDITTRSGSAAELSAWGDDLINGTNGIRSTSEPASIFVAP